MSVDDGVVLGFITVGKLLVLPGEHGVCLCIVYEATAVGNDIYRSRINLNLAELVVNIVVFGNVDLLFISDDKGEHVILVCGISDVGERAC